MAIPFWVTWKLSYQLILYQQPEWFGSQKKRRGQGSNVVDTKSYIFLVLFFIFVIKKKKRKPSCSFPDRPPSAEQQLGFLELRVSGPPKMCLPLLLISLCSFGLLVMMIVPSLSLSFILYLLIVNDDGFKSLFELQFDSP